jgi:retinoid hydroxylase
MITPPRIEISKLPPGSLGFPIIGEGFNLIIDPNKFAMKRFEKHGSIFKTKIFGSSTIYVRGGEAINFVVTNENKYFSNNLPPSTKSLIGPYSLSNQSGTLHQNRRRLIYKVFSPRAVSSYSKEIDNITQEYLEKWAVARSFAWYPELKKYTFDVACKFLIGTVNTSESILGSLFDKWSEGLFSFSPPIPGTKLYKALNSRKKLQIELEKIIVNRRNSSIDNNDALSVFLNAQDESGEKLETEEIKDQILTLLFAGHETLTSALSTFCLNLALFPKILEKCRLEQKTLGFNSELNQLSLDKMTYLESVLVEVLRINPPVGGGFKKVIKSCEFNGMTFPEGWNVIYSINATHNDNANYFNAEQFNPERLTTVEVDKKNKASDYTPFGGGVRECVGKEFARKEMKIFAARLVQGYEWSLQPSQNLDMAVIPVPYPKDKLKINFSKL